MKEHVKNLWVDALQSGKYKQSKNHLKTDNGYCCLGVLCDVYAKNQKKKGFSTETNLSNAYAFPDGKNEETKVLPDRVVKWSGMNSTEGHVVDISYGKTLLSILNDDGQSFDEIVNVIERNWEKL
jgi:hypothetical protein